MWLPLALAARADDLSFMVTRVVPTGTIPAITFHAATDGTMQANVRCAGRTFSLTQALAAGTETALSLPLPEGAHTCSGLVRFDKPSGDWAEVPLQFPVVVRSPLRFTVSLADVDLAGRRLVVHADQPLVEATVTRVGLGGAVLGTERADLSEPRDPVFTWTDPAEVLVLRVAARDADGIAGSVELSPWFYAIPHDDVVFASGSDIIAAEEAKKLERCWQDVAMVRDKYGAVVDIELFVAGFTDTVGPAASNRTLSERRAAAIAAWFRSRGFSGSVWYQGFGEDVLAAPTADEVDEVRNRRALYLLSAEQPAVSPALPSDRWRRL